MNINTAPHPELLVQSGFVFRSVPPNAGGYDLGYVTLMLTRRPHRLARFLCRWLLDWRWVDT